MNQALTQFIEEFQRNKEIQERQFPLKYLLILYLKSSKQDTYCNYFEGFKALVKWLAPIQIPTAPTLTTLFLPLYNYEQQEIARILGCSPVIIQQTFLEIYNELSSN